MLVAIVDLLRTQTSPCALTMADALEECRWCIFMRYPKILIMNGDTFQSAIVAAKSVDEARIMSPRIVGF